MIQANNQNINIKTLTGLLFTRNSKKKCEEWFRNYTGKKHILITSSCRTALYLAYKASGIEKEVITTPLTCYSALAPILAAKLPIVFCDINEDNLLMDTSLTEKLISKKTGFIQAVHHGGKLIDMKRLRKTADKHSLLLIEDCAQGFGALKDGVSPGSLSDIACFTLTKNAYGIGGGILATNDEDIFCKALEIQMKFKPFSKILLNYRLARSFLETHRRYKAVEFLYNALMKIKRVRKRVSYDTIQQQIRFARPAKLFASLFTIQERKFNKLHQNTKNRSVKLDELLIDHGIKNQIDYQSDCDSFVKYFYLNLQINSPKTIYSLIKSGIEAKHLETRHYAVRQPRADEMDLFRNSKGLNDCKNYFKVYDSIVQLPLHHKTTSENIKTIVESLIKILNEKSID